MRSMTILIPSYQRREPLRRLLEALDASVVRQPELGEGLDILVVLDGSTDGSREMCDQMELQMSLTAHWKPNAGRAAARNAGLERARGDIILMLDDDMVPADDLLARHRDFHEHHREPAFLMGPCLFPRDVEVVGMNRGWAEEQYARLAQQGEVLDPDDGSFANTSAPLALIRELGGFDPRFVGWGGEDYEMALRILRAGVPLRYEHALVAWHLQHRGIIEFCGTKRDQGRNMVRIVELHPDTIHDVFPLRSTRSRLRALRRLPAPILAMLARVGAWAAALEDRLPGSEARRVLGVAFELNLLAGVAGLDPGGRYRARLLGEG